MIPLTNKYSFGIQFRLQLLQWQQGGKYCEFKQEKGQNTSKSKHEPKEKLQKIIKRQ